MKYVIIFIIFLILFGILIDKGHGAENKRYQIIKINHVYSGGIARLFLDGSVSPTEVFVVPESVINQSGPRVGVNIKGFN